MSTPSNNTSEKNQSDDINLIFNSFIDQIHSLDLSKGDETYLPHFDAVKATAKNLVEELCKLQEVLLSQFNGWMLPIAQEAFTNLTKETIDLEKKLNENLETWETFLNHNWTDHAQLWVSIYGKWQDRDAFIQGVIKTAAAYTHALIDRDLQVIHDYQTHSLAPLLKKKEELEDYEKRLKTATEESLKQLINLKKPPTDLSLVQEAEWIANLPQERQKFFNQILMKIDAVSKEIVRADEIHDPEVFSEVEGDLAFMEKELHHLNEMIHKLNLNDKNDVQFMNERLIELLEHLGMVKEMNLPKVLLTKAEKIENMISASLFRLNEQ